MRNAQSRQSMRGTYPAWWLLQKYPHMENLPPSPVPSEKVLAPIPPPAAAVSPHAAAWGELQILQNKGEKKSILGGVILLLVSLFLFAGTGAARWSWQRCAMIIGVLFIHELGHYFAMRWFKYRELRMFFIPFFGAAVSGRHFNVPGWKKAIVSLMGPLPGILLGAGLAVGGLLTFNDTLVEVSMLVIGLNVFNLLPILPLDGGWFWNAMLFCRHRWLEAGFQAVAGLALLAASARGMSKIWLYLGIVMLMKIPATLRLGAIAKRLRTERWKPGGDDFVSEQMAETLFQELSNKSPKTTPKAVAAEALAVFEKINASPPNWLESLGLTALYVGALFVAVIGLGLAGLHQQGTAQARLTPAAAAPIHVPVLDSQFDSKLMRVVATKPAKETDAQSFFYATYPEPAAAEAGFSEVRSSLQPHDSLLRFGQTLVATTVAKVSNKEHARQIREKLSQSGNLIVAGDGFSWAQCDLAFTVPDQATAKRLYRELDLTLRLPGGFQPPAPWDQTCAPRNSEAMLKARATYLRVVEVQAEAAKDEALAKHQQRTVITTLFNKKNSANQWQQIATERLALERKAVERLEKSSDPGLDHDVIALMLRQPKRFATREEREQWETWQSEMRRLLTGDTEAPVMRLDDEEGETYAERLTGSVALKGNRLTLTGVTFGRADKALADLASWLTNNGYTDVRYGFYDGAAEFRKLRAVASK
jgi:Zn-dependent protease